MNTPITDWRGKRVWLLGASTGIGAALATALLALGARVAVSARSAGKLTTLTENAPAALVLPCDASDADSVANAWQELLRQWGGVDVAIYLAGDYVPMRAWDLDMGAGMASARHMMDTNLVGALAFAACVVPHLLAREKMQKIDEAAGAGPAEIAFVASVAGYRGLPKSLIYGPTKAALINFAEALALDLQPRGIGVRIINPGFVATLLTAKNDFSMPALMTAKEAAAEIIAGYRSSAFEIHFPKRFTCVMKLLALLPARFYFPLVRRMTGA
jgi:NAD(P)-dependent dehydrogenase (short-subunit alcohol dehydrogenase family)